MSQAHQLLHDLADACQHLEGALQLVGGHGMDQAASSSCNIGYSPYCVPRVVGGIKGVIVSPLLRALEPMAWDFVMNFARDNDLVVVDEPDLDARHPALRRRRRGHPRAFSVAPECPGGDGQSLHLRRQPALQPRRLVLVEDALVGNRVDDGLGGLVQIGSLGLVASDDGTSVRS